MILALGAGLLLISYLVTRAAGFRRGAEVAVATWCIAMLLVVAPMHALTLTATLTKTSLLVAMLAELSAVSAALGLVRRRAAWADLRALATLPRLRPIERSVAVILVAIVGLHALIGTWLLPSESWDGIWYHDTIVGWVIQTGSADPMRLPPNLLQQVNGFPRNAELTSAWCVLLSDRRWIELPNTIALVPFSCGTYLLARKFSRSASAPAVLACVAALVPGLVLQLRSTYVDVYAAAACVASLWFATKGPLTPRDALLAAIAAGLHLGTKPTALLVAPIVLVVVAARMLLDVRVSTFVRWSTVAGTALVGALFAALVYARNALVFGNPVYPVAVDLPRLGISWPGVRGSGEVDVNAGTLDALASVFGLPHAGRDFADIRSGGYGSAFAWIVMPLAILGLGRAIVAGWSKRPVDRRRALSLLVLAGVVTPSLALSPALWAARYQLHVVAVASALAAYALGLDPIRRLRGVALAVAVGLTVVALVRFEPPLGGAPPRRLWSALALSARERAAMTEAEWTLEPHVAAAREAELGPGDVVAFGPEVTFPSVLYNERFDNVLAYVPASSPGDIHFEIDTLQPKWVVAKEGEPLHEYVTSFKLAPRYERIGLASRGHPTVAFRRVAERPAK